MIESLIENSFIIVIGIIITAGFTGITGYFKKRTNCLQKVADEVEDLQKRDINDMTRIESPLIIPEGSLYIDNSNIDMSEVLNLVKENLKLQ